MGARGSVRHDPAAPSPAPPLSLANQIGTVASVITVGAFVPQSLKILRQGDAGAVSLRMYLLLVSASRDSIPASVRRASR